MKVKDLIHLHCKDIAEKAASDINIILEPSEQPHIVTEDYIQEFFNQLLKGSKIMVQQQHISVISNGIDTTETIRREQLEHDIKEGFWVYMYSKEGLVYQQFDTKEAAEHFYHFTLTKDLADWKGIISTKQSKVYMWKNGEKHGGEEKI